MAYEFVTLSASSEEKVVIESWRRHFNEMRTHSRLGYLTPAEFAAKTSEQNVTLRPATGRIAAVCGASKLQTVAYHPRERPAKERERLPPRYGLKRRRFAF